MIGAMRIPGAIAILLCVAVGCSGDDGGTESGASTAMQTGTSTTMPMTSTSTSTTDATQGGTGSTGEPPSTEGSGTAPGTSTSEPSSSSGMAESAEGGDVCDPETYDHPCLQCFVDDCCQHWMSCLADEGCSCMIDCHVIEGGSLGSCESQCDSDGELYQAVFFCGQMYCLGTCDWDCC
jgi:hypothetical protein